MAIRPIVVTVIRDGDNLLIDPPLVNLSASEGVEWRFQNIARENLMYIQFQSPAAVLGPFQTLSLKEDCSCVLGMGNTGQPGTYLYNAMLLDCDHAVAASSEPAIVVNQSTKKDTSPEVVVLYDQMSKTVTVSPFKMELQPGQSANWHILGVPGDHFVTFRFLSFDDPMTGPFSSFNISSGMAGMALLAQGGNFSGPEEQIQYRVAVRDSVGKVIDSQDPLIDTLGDPPH